MFELEWLGNSTTARSWREVESALAEIEAASRDPVAVTVIRAEAGEMMIVGLGHERSVLTYMPGSLEPPYFTTVGDLRSDERISFMFGNQWSGFSLAQTVSRAAALDALRHFCETGERSDAVDWDMD